MRYILLLTLLSTLGFSEPETFESAPPQVKYATGLKIEKGWSKKVLFRSALTGAITLPRHFDWREQGTLTTPSDQGTCGSCWGFSTVGVLQDAIALTDKKQVDLSEQYLLSCNTRGYSCNGGDFIHDMHISPGAVLESAFPYVNKQVACKSGLSYPYRLSSWAYVPTTNESAPPALDEIKAAIYQHGPIAAAMAVNSAFQSYKSGVFNKCDNTAPNHAISIVGWDDDGGYFIAKNSWGSTSWGEQGFFRIKYGCNYIGLEANYIMYAGGTPTPGPSPSPSPAPTPTPTPVPKCTPMPYAAAGPTQYARRGQTINVGGTVLPGTAYRWEINGVVNQRLRTSPIHVQLFANAIITQYATTKCGTARSSMMAILRR